MAEDRTKADFIKGTFAVRADRLRAKGPRGDGAIPQAQYDALYGILWDACEVFCWVAQSDPDRQRRFPDYDMVTGIVTGPVVAGDDRVWLTGTDALLARRRKLRWLVEKYMAEFGPMSISFRNLLRGQVHPVELRAAVRLTWDNHPVRGAFQGNADDPRPLDFEAV